MAKTFLTADQKADLKKRLVLIYQKWIVDSLVVQGYPCNESIAEQITRQANFIADNLMLNFEPDEYGLFPLTFLKTSDIKNNILTLYTEQRPAFADYEGVIVFIDDSLQLHTMVSKGVYNRDCISIQGITGVPYNRLTEGYNDDNG